MPENVGGKASPTPLSFEIALVYIGTENVEINLSRIRDRQQSRY
jgi:predicted ABC-type ATPase